ncbi:MAG: FAD binding domain-containing protein [Actinomycetota bacterium]
MISFPTSYESVEVPDGAVIRSGGTDLQERLRTDNATPELVDLTGIPDFRGITTDDAGTRIGGGTRMTTVAVELADIYPALAITTGGLATPQIRAQGTFAGNLAQRTRCWYYRHPGFECFKSGGDGCPARDGRHLYGVVFDTSGCVHPHPSSIAMALLCHDDAIINCADGSEMTVEELLGDGTDPTRDNLLGPTDVIRAIRLAPPWPGERGAYFRSISRFEAEWPLVECVVRATLEDGVVARIAIGLGGVATVPLRMHSAEAVLAGDTLSDDAIASAAATCVERANPLPETGYKVELISATVTETLERLRGGSG